jgi:hypothetical protein
VSVRVADSSWSASARIPVDLPAEARLSLTHASSGSKSPLDALKIAVVADGKTFDHNRVSTGIESCVTAWVEDISPGTTKSSVCFRLNGTDLPVTFIGEESQGRRQINAMLPSGLEPGDYSLTVRLGDRETPPVRVQLFRK